MGVSWNGLDRELVKMGKGGMSIIEPVGPSRKRFNSDGAPGRIRMCRELPIPSWRRRRFECTAMLRHVSVVTDPTKLAFLNAEVERRLRETQADLKRKTT